jgi:hypothetical protein
MIEPNECSPRRACTIDAVSTFLLLAIKSRTRQHCEPDLPTHNNKGPLTVVSGGASDGH